MRLDARARIELVVSPEEAFDLVADLRNFPRLMRPRGIIPGISGAEMVAGAVPSAGAHRMIKLTDGNVVEEEILAFDRPSQHRYRWMHPPARPFSLIVSGAEGTWTFEPSERGHGTTLIWNYRFALTSVFAYPIALLIIVSFRRFMEQTLEQVRAALSEASSTTR
jgi:hypothetical protein